MNVKPLIDYTTVLRSKNAGPLYITFDLIFPNRETMEYVQDRLDPLQIAAAYGTDPSTVQIIPYGVVNSIKITFPRKNISGSLADDDIYGCQQHGKLAKLMI